MQQSSNTMKSGAFQKVSQSALFVSEPSPHMFGNPPNAVNDSSWTNKNWLKSRFHFSFAEYHNPKRARFGAMRVMNDDLVQPQRGFGQHSHRDAEIVTYVIEGELTHQDSMGTKETLGPGSVQFMTAGSGVSHSEHNLNASKPLRFIQMWFDPRRRGLKPNYGSLCGSKVDMADKWAHLVSDVEQSSMQTPIKLNQDIQLYVADIKANKSLDFCLKDGRMAYILCMEGKAAIKGSHGEETLDRHEAAHVVAANNMTISGPAHCMMIEMADAK